MVSTRITDLLPKKRTIEEVWSSRTGGGAEGVPSLPNSATDPSLDILEKIEQNTREAYTVALLQRVEQNLKVLRDAIPSSQQKANHIVNYYLDTSKTSEQTIDLIKDIGMPMHSMTVMDTGGGFTFKVNDEGAPITPFKTFGLENEILNKVYWTGSGTSGTAHVRFGMWM